jgi:hypothetical protein
MKIPCGGWRRPHSYFLGDVPEMKNCFAFVKVCFCFEHSPLKKLSEQFMFLYALSYLNYMTFAH